MANKYRVLLPLEVQTEDGGVYHQGDVFEKEFVSTFDEEANINSGLLEIVPRTYKVVGTTRVAETAPGGEFQAAFLMGQEEALIAGGHIERVDPKPTKAPPKKEKGE